MVKNFETNSSSFYNVNFLILSLGTFLIYLYILLKIDILNCGINDREYSL